MSRLALIVSSVLLFAGCVLFRSEFERTPVGHILILLPLLALSGALMAAGFKSSLRAPKEPYANAATLVAVLTVLFWMLPRYIDLSLSNPWLEAAKYFMLPALVGAPLALAWRCAHSFLHGFIKANTLSMLGGLAYLYTHAPIRICNSYLLSEQEELGVAFLFLALALAALWVFPLFFPPTTRSQSQSKDFERSTI